jgi:hypothetical protein
LALSGVGAAKVRSSKRLRKKTMREQVMKIPVIIVLTIVMKQFARIASQIDQSNYSREIPTKEK